MLQFCYMKNKQKGFIASILLVIIALLAIGGGVYVYESKRAEVPVSSTNTETKSTNQIEAVSTTSANPSSLKYGFELKNTPNYSISFSVENCDDMACNGAGIVTIKDNQSKVLIQTINSNDLYFFKDTLAKTSTSDTVLYDEQSPVIVGDFNFDGSADIAVRNGNNSGYGGPSYDIYLLSTTNKRFVLSESLTKLAFENLGMFFVDKDKKLLITYSKSGCCWHETDQYQVVNNQPVLIYVLVEDAGGDAKVKEGNMLITEKKFIDGKWVSATREVSQKEYYGN